MNRFIHCNKYILNKTQYNCILLWFLIGYNSKIVILSHLMTICNIVTNIIAIHRNICIYEFLLTIVTVWYIYLIKKVSLMKTCFQNTILMNEDCGLKLKRVINSWKKHQKYNEYTYVIGCILIKIGWLIENFCIWTKHDTKEKTQLFNRVTSFKSHNI